MCFQFSLLSCCRILVLFSLACVTRFCSWMAFSGCIGAEMDYLTLSCVTAELIYCDS